MDQIQIGKFIAACRREKGMTQAQLAEKMGVSDRAVSKWETGKNMPDSSIMLDLCSELGISVNDLLNGRRIAMDNYKKIAEKTMLEMRQVKEQNDRMLLHTEILMCSLSVALLLVLNIFAKYAEMPDWVRVLLVIVSFLQLIPCICFQSRLSRRQGTTCAKTAENSGFRIIRRYFFHRISAGTEK
ncbi:MAG: helix-turn-helix transcriptional regulator [Oscillospiraceae bacterium]|nr:helix-turn-helix transcriptional regulator [Oscillospiraceae bacterium]